MVQESGPETACSHRKSTCCARPPLLATPGHPEPRAHSALAWRSHALFQPCHPTFSAPKGQGCGGWGGGGKEMGARGGIERKLGDAGRVPRMHGVRIPLPTPCQSRVGSLSMAAACPRYVHLSHGGHCPDGWQHEPGLPHTCPQPASQHGVQGPDCRPEQTALPSLLPTPCTTDMAMACCRVVH